MRKWFLILIIISAVQCRESYNVIRGTTGNGLLVVEGIINANGRTSIKLSRTTRLSQLLIAAERGALLLIEGETNGLAFPLVEQGDGLYVSDVLQFDQADKYRLRITTSDNKEYASDFKNFIVSPPVDSLSWKQEGDGVRIYAYANGLTNGSRYYKWDAEETWEFKSAMRTNLVFRPTLPGSPDPYAVEYYTPDHQVNEKIFTCWQDRNSTSINLVSTVSLEDDVLFQQVQFIPRAAWELSFLYSINLNLVAISQDGYDFYTKMKKNTESLGSIFDAQPSEISGNIKCLTDPSELVIGYLEFTTAESKRIFINNEELDNWGYDLGCTIFGDPEFPYPYPNAPSIFPRLIEKDIMPTVPAETAPGGGIITFHGATGFCVDCTRRGTNVKPDFWP